MQKLLLTTVSAIALGVCATAALAGGSSTYIDQTGTGQTATVTQTSATDGSVGTLADPFVQQGSNNTISITQTGTNDNVQGDSELTPYVVPRPAAGLVGQSGTGNNATIKQSGGASGAGNGEYVTLYQVGNFNGTGTIGSLNGGTIDQGSGDDQTASVFENGWYNQFNILQKGPGSSDLYNGVDLEQTGNYNSGQIAQNGVDLGVTAYQYAYYNVLTSNQWGQGNSLWSLQTNTSDVYYNTITNRQSGWGNLAYVGLNALGFNSNTDNYEPPFYQGQNGTDLTITNTQFGASDSLVVLNQGDGAGFNLSITNTQGGYKNSLTVTDQSGSDSSITSKQFGANNTALVTEQTGSDNTISNQQYGWNGSATFYQNGSYNVADLTQSGYDNGATSTQNGYYNAAYLTQSSGDNIITGVQVGTGNTGWNTATVTQASYGNTANYSQNGSGNTASIKQ